MNNQETKKEMEELLKQAVTPVKHPELRRDLWPQMLSKLNEHPAPARNVPWFDWALAVLAGAALIFFPGIIPALFYHL
ncbi:MAG: hypothetical protein WA639_16870 [Candidatus Acidiferrum sp.]